MSSILILPIIELILVGALAGVVGVLAVLGRQVFFAEAITHATFPGAVVGVVIAAALGLSHSWISVFLFIGAFLMCIPIGALFGLSRVGTTSSAAGIVLTFGFALGYFLNKWFAPLPVKVESFLVGSVLNVNKIDIALSGGLLLLVALVLLARWRQLVFFTFDPESFSGLIVLTLVALIPAVGTILSIALLAAPAAALVGVVNDTRLLFVLAPLMGIAIGLVGLFIAVATNLSVGGCIGVCAGCFYVPLKIASTRNNAKV